MPSMQPLSDHERVRRELWAAIYRQEHDQSATRVKPEFRFREAADAALTAFDKRFAHGERACAPGCHGNDSESYCERTQSSYCGLTNPDMVKLGAGSSGNGGVSASDHQTLSKKTP